MTMNATDPDQLSSSRRSSVYSLATDLPVLPDATARKEKQSLISKLLNGRSKHRQTVSEDMEWHCKGQDLEDNFMWSTGENMSKLPAALGRRLSSTQTFHSVSTSDSSDFSEPVTPVSSRPSSVQISATPANFVLNLFEEQEKFSLYKPIEVKPLNLSKRGHHRSTHSLAEFADARRKRNEDKAIEALEAYFTSRNSIYSVTSEEEASLSPCSYKTTFPDLSHHTQSEQLPHRLHRFSHSRRPPRLPSLDFAKKSLPPIPSEWEADPTEVSMVLANGRPSSVSVSAAATVQSKSYHRMSLSASAKRPTSVAHFDTSSMSYSTTPPRLSENRQARAYGFV